MRGSSSASQRTSKIGAKSTPPRKSRKVKVKVRERAMRATKALVADSGPGWSRISKSGLSSSQTAPWSGLLSNAKVTTPLRVIRFELNTETRMLPVVTLHAMPRRGAVWSSVADQLAPPPKSEPSFAKTPVRMIELELELVHPLVPVAVKSTWPRPGAAAEMDCAAEKRPRVQLPTEAIP